MYRKILALSLALCTLLVLFVPMFDLSVEATTASQVELERVQIDTTINNGYAVTEITHHYLNPVNETQEVLFKVTLPDAAFISNMSLSVGNRTVYAQVLAKDEATRQYDQAVAAGQTAGLGQTGDSKTFTFAVNLKGEAELSLTLRYEQFLTKFLGQRTYELYLSSMDLGSAALDLSITVDSLSGLTSLDPTSYDGLLARDWEGTGRVTLTLDEDPYVDRGDLRLTYGDEPLPLEGNLLSYYDEATDQYYFMNLFAPARADLGGQISKDIVFVLDKSGSMGTEKMGQMREAFKNIIDQLPETDRFNLIMFDNQVRVYSESLLQATQQNRTEAKDYLDDVHSGGSTNLYDSLERALEMLSYSESRAPIVLMLTDGLANSGKYDDPHLIRQHILAKNREHALLAPIFTLGFGEGPDEELLTALSLENNARATMIEPGAQAGEAIGDLYATISTTLLKDITFNYPATAYDIFPAALPALYEGSEAVIVGKLDLANHSGELETLIQARSYDGQRQLEQSYPVDLNSTDDDYIQRFWAYAKIKDLEGRLVLMSPEEKTAAESQMEQLALAAHFATPYTSLFIAVEELEEGSEEPAQDQDDNSEGPTYPKGYVPPAQDDYGRGYNDPNKGNGAPTDDNEAFGDSPGPGILLVLGTVLAVALLGLRRRR